MFKHQINEKLLSLTIKRDRAKAAFEDYKRKLSAERRAIRLPKDALEALTEDVCPICYDIHATKDTIMTSCKHQFGTQCYIQHIRTCIAHAQEIRCPMCNNTEAEIHIFREKVAPVRKPKGTPVRGKGAIGDAVYLLQLSKVRTQAQVQVQA